MYLPRFAGGTADILPHCYFVADGPALLCSDLLHRIYRHFCFVTSLSLCICLLLLLLQLFTG